MILSISLFRKKEVFFIFFLDFSLFKIKFIHNRKSQKNNLKNIRILMKENILPDLNFPFVEEMKEFSRPFFPDKKASASYGKWHLKAAFPDEKNLLETAYESCRRYISSGGYEECDFDGYLLETKQEKTEKFEAYFLTLSPGKCVISANDTEGIRRGIYEFIDLFCANGGSFPEKEEVITRKPFLSIRLGRCPFSPIKRWPVNTDELLDDIDYYPDAYLETLARDGINGIWLVTQLRELGKSSFTKEDPQRKRRLEKLSRVAEKCGRFGVKVWLFMIEPFAVPDEDELYKEHPELFMPAVIKGMKHCFCPAAEETGKYLREITKDVFSSVPALGGIVDIVYGERPTTCPSTKSSHDDSPILCQNQCSLNTNEIMQKALQAISDGIRAGSKEAKLIAWYYMPHAASLSSFCKDFAKYTPEDVIAQFNFESGGEKIQLGKKHCAGDYWVSYEGPAERYKEAALQRTNGPMGAKLQLGCGHELTPVPYIPVPEIAYNKYKAMYELNVSSVMQSWYIGNFPGLMERACGRLAFEDFSGGKEDFLLRLARPFWGKYSEEVVKAWEIFNKGYQLFPFSLLFQYYAPQNAFMMWKYHFLPDLAPLAPPWKPNFEFGGDTIGEAMAGFTLEDTAILMKEMSKEWKNGMEKLLPLKEIYKESIEHLRDIGNAELIGILIEGTSYLLDFFLLRKRLYTEKLMQNEYISLIEEMKQLLSQHKELCKKCIPILEADSRLGYHGEALCRIFDEEKTAKALLTAEESMKEAQMLLDAVKSGMTPLQYAEKTILDVLPQNTEQKAENFKWKWQVEKDKFLLKVYDLPAGKDVSIKAYFTDMTGSSFPMQDVFNIEKGECIRKQNILLILTGENFDSNFHVEFHNNSLIAAWPLSSIPGAVRDKMFRFTFSINIAGTNTLAKGEGGIGRLYLGNIRPNETYAMYV